MSKFTAISPSQLTRCTNNAWGECVSIYQTVTRELKEPSSDSDLDYFIKVIWRVFGPLGILLLTFITVFMSDTFGILKLRRARDPEDYMDGFKLLEAKKPQVVLEVSNRFYEINQRIKNDIMDVDNFHRRTSSSYELRMTPRQLGVLVSERIAWLASLEAARSVHARASPKAILPAPPASLLIEDVTETGSDLEGGDVDADLNLLEDEESVKADRDSDSESDTGDFCVIPDIANW